MKAHIQCSGDPSVGIPGCHTQIDLCVTIDDERMKEDIRDMLRDTFSLIWDDTTTFVVFDDEIGDYPTI